MGDSEDDVINVEHEIYSLRTSMIGEDRTVIATTLETNISPLAPGMGFLFEAIPSFY